MVLIKYFNFRYNNNNHNNNNNNNNINNNNYNNNNNNNNQKMEDKKVPSFLDSELRNAALKYGKIMFYFTIYIYFIMNL